MKRSIWGHPKFVSGPEPLIKRADVATLLMIANSTYARMEGDGSGASFGIDMPTMLQTHPYTANLYQLVTAEITARQNCLAAKQYHASRTPGYRIAGAVSIRRNQHAAVYIFDDKSRLLVCANGRHTYMEPCGAYMAERIG